MLNFKMGHLGLALAISLNFANFAQAQDEEPTPLAVAMQEMGNQLKAAGQLLSAKGDLPANLAIPRAIVTEVGKALPLIPLKVQTGPVANSNELLIQYKRLLTELLVSVIDLEEDFATADAEGALATINVIKEIRKKGHDLFK